MKKNERIIVVILRWVGIAELLAILAVYMPFSWMQAIHAGIGLGDLHEQAIVSYLARSLSAFYALHGAFTLVLTRDIRRYWLLVRYWALAAVIMGIALLVIDLAIDLPWWWTLHDGPFVVAIGVVILLLHRNVDKKRGPDAAATWERG